jgi:hypothetical protein
MGGYSGQRQLVKQSDGALEQLRVIFLPYLPFYYLSQSVYKIYLDVHFRAPGH